jgi:hypothetical protein
MSRNTSGGFDASDDMDAQGRSGVPDEWPDHLSPLVRWAQAPAESQDPPAELMATFRVAAAQANVTSPATSRTQIRGQARVRARGWVTGRRGKFALVGAGLLVGIPSIAMAAPTNLLPEPLRVVVEQVREVTKAVLQPLLPDAPAQRPQPITPGSEPAPLTSAPGPSTPSPTQDPDEGIGTSGSEGGPEDTAVPSEPAVSSDPVSPADPGQRGKPSLVPTPTWNQRPTPATPEQVTPKSPPPKRDKSPSIKPVQPSSKPTGLPSTKAPTKAPTKAGKASTQTNSVGTGTQAEKNVPTTKQVQGASQSTSQNAAKNTPSGKTSSSVTTPSKTPASKATISPKPIKSKGLRRIEASPEPTPEVELVELVELP